MPERLRRLENLYQQFPIYFVTACTAGRRRLLPTPAIHDSFKRHAETAPKFGAWVGSYILMPDHFHLFVVLDDRKLTLPQWMKSLKGALSSQLRIDGHQSPFWQKGFFDHVLRGAESYSAKWNYVRENAVRAGLVSDWRDWPYLGEICPLEHRRE
jgi:putative transposase